MEYIFTWKKKPKPARRKTVLDVIDAYKRQYKDLRTAGTKEITEALLERSAPADLTNLDLWGFFIWSVLDDKFNVENYITRKTMREARRECR